MATPGQISLYGNSPNLQTGSKNIGPITMTGSTVQGAITDFVPVAGVNSVVAPSTTVVAAVIVPNGCGMIAVGSSSATFFVSFPAQASGYFAVLPFSSTLGATFNLFASSSNGTVEVSWI